MQNFNNIYFFNYNSNENQLCKFESKYIFGKEEKDKLLFSDIKIEPASSAFIKKRFDIISFSEDYDELIRKIKKEDIHAEGFKVEYIVLNGDKTEYPDRLKKLKDIGYSIEGLPDYHKPTKTYALCYFENTWYFGLLIKNSFDWHKHRQKPHSYSNSISLSIAKALVNVASYADKDKKLLDACCGVGTVILEACFAGFNIEGCDINRKVCNQAKENLKYFNYNTNIYHADIKDISNTYDAAIVDLPYNVFCMTDDENIAHIINATARLTNRIIIVSTTDISHFLEQAKLEVSDYCTVEKIGKTSFSRRIWVCEK